MTVLGVGATVLAFPPMLSVKRKRCTLMVERTAPLPSGVLLNHWSSAIFLSAFEGVRYLMLHIACSS